MSGKRYPGKFTIQFNVLDPTHRQVIDLLEPMGRTKAQFLANAVLHYIHCTQTPDIPQPAPVDHTAIEVIVRRILAEQEQKPEQTQPQHPKKEQGKPLRQSEDIRFEDAAQMLGEESLAAIADTLSALRGK
ncbi:MAG: hypothetical protein AAGU32_13485 [Bacillota bacterium]